MIDTYGPDQSAEAPSAARLIRERDFFLGLLELREQDPSSQLLPKALNLLVKATGAQHGYIELSEGPRDADSVWHAAEGYSEQEIETVRFACSRGIVAEALATGQVLQTASAMLDPRFFEFDSVRVNKIQAVLCAPIGRRQPLGVVYLEGAQDAGPFDPRAEWLTKMFARSVAPIFEHLTAKVQGGAEDLSHILPFRGLVVYSPTMRDVLAKLALAAPLDVNILFTGPSGTGKSLLARATHANSHRASGPFQEVNCAALPDNLIENELFGSAPGGHSAAPRGGSEGRVGAAEGGTLFLDDVGELSLPAQAKLLQLLQSKQYFRLGDSRPRRADVRIFAATNSDLDTAVREGRFREDLLYRLRVLDVDVPALAKRPEDIPPLADHFLRQACKTHGFDELEFSPASATAIAIAEWPGNIRQLAHAIEAGTVNAVVAHARFVEPAHIFPSRRAHSANNDDVSLQAQLLDVRAKIVAAALRETDWNISEAARRLDVARSYLYKLIRAHDLRRDAPEQ